MRIIENIKNILGDNTSMSNKEKFEEEFGPPDSDSENESDDEESETAAVKSKKKSKKRKEGLDKPEDWKALFKGEKIAYLLFSFVRSFLLSFSLSTFFSIFLQKILLHYLLFSNILPTSFLNKKNFLVF